MATAARPMRADARRNYERLLAVAREAITERGAEVSLDDIARRAHVGPGTLYRHFPNRDALLGAVLADWAEELRRQGDDLVADPDPAGALDRWLRLLLGHLGTYRGSRPRSSPPPGTTSRRSHRPASRCTTPAGRWSNAPVRRARCGPS
ncbi:hypothetical protein Athai_42330 [Actinocatenispora thailandica]|uniref:HTH tetR-type domain-containing protein n=1 Tax=Actinocatenispora thailandica TaxID=227318 RepID=A0A7R7DRV1_9ACTN|nr:helix-turn-helix domain-containing protein [Actinocatenispora thailandica]BCJ36730.1 hypothetical protein Athai_42330 [Actinocatenispora thailandica]